MRLLRGLLRYRTCIAGNRCILALRLTVFMTLFCTAGGEGPWLYHDLPRTDGAQHRHATAVRANGERGVDDAGPLPALGSGSEEVADRRHVKCVFLLRR